jgi:hypothetical protein
MEFVFSSGLLTTILPTLVIAMSGLICAVVWRDKHPLTSVVVSIGMIAFILSSCAQGFAQYQLYVRSSETSFNDLYNGSLRLVYFASSVLSITGSVLTLIAVFIERPVRAPK